MDKQRPVNKVAHNDAYSSKLMEMYTNWMDGDCFQGSNIPEAFAGMEPQSHGAEIEDTTKKKKEAKKEKSVAEEVKCKKCGGSHPTDECPNILEREEIEVDGELIILEKIKMDEGSMAQARDNVGASTCWNGYKAKGTKKKGGKVVPNCVKEEESIEEAKKGLFANIHAKRKRGEAPAKPGSEDYPAKDAFKKSARTAKKEEVEYTVEKKLDPVGKEDKDVDNDGDHDKSDKYLLARRKKVSKIIAMSKKK